MSTEQCRDIEALNPIPRRACNAFLEECKRQGVQIFITETYRSQARQNHLFEQGRTRPGIVVTWTLKSNHTGRMAWDIACSPPQKLYDEKVLAKAGAIAKELGITWGGSWQGKKDSPHMETDNLWVLPKKIDNDLIKAVQKLMSKSIIGSPAAWNSVDRIRPGNLMSLVIKTGVEMFSNADYTETINKMVEVGIISSPKIWLDHTYSVDNIRSLLIKIASKL